MINYEHMFYTLSSIDIQQDLDFGSFRSILTGYQFVSESYIHGNNYEYNKEWILVLK